MNGPKTGETGGRSPSRDALALRVVSAAVLAPAAVGAAWLGGPVFAALVAFLCILMTFEWARMIERAELSPVFFALAAGGAAALLCASRGQYGFAYGACAFAGAAAAVGALAGSRRWVWAAFGAFYLLVPCVALIWLRESVDNGRGMILLLFAIVWSADTGGYVGGRLVGGPKLNPAVSPAKTWAGAAGGFLAGGAASAIGAPLVYGAAPNLSYVAMGASLGVASILGDVAESAFKRNFGVKDMSGFIPGHGGVLDRLDGMIFATLAVTAVIYGHILAAGVGE
jgi:phosphatidate cytidylyltransferase